MPRLRLAPLFALSALSASAQSNTVDYDALAATFRVPNNSFSVGVRYSGKSSVKFSGLGTIATSKVAGTTTGDESRTYDDGYVSMDSRTAADGTKLQDDGRTNTWNYTRASQITADESGVTFHTYSSTTDGEGVAINAASSAGIDIEYGHQFGHTTARAIDKPPALAWGLLFGFGMNDVNLKTRGTIRATLNTLTDTYSLLGYAPPVSTDTTTTGYTAPSSVTETVTNADGTTSTFVVDTTTFLGNRPESRVETAQTGLAEIEGFWQVKGAYFTLRTGPWIRWQPMERVSFRFSAGASLGLLGLRIRYDERLKVDSDLAGLEATEETENQAFGVPGYFGAVDAEWWLTKRTGFFGGATYEQFSRDAKLDAGGRTADVNVSSGLGLRIGITTRF